MRVRLRLPRAERSLKAQVATQPLMKAPWSFFDFSKVQLYAGDERGFLDALAEGLTVVATGDAPQQPVPAEGRAACRSWDSTMASICCGRPWRS